MSEQERREQILQAEAAIRQLAEELGRASERTTMAESAREKLEEAAKNLGKAETLLNNAAALVASQREGLDAAVKSLSMRVAEGIDRLQAASRSLEACPSALSNQLAEAVQKEMGAAIKSMSSHVADGVNKLQATCRTLEACPAVLSNQLTETVQKEMGAATTSMSQQIAEGVGKLEAACRTLEACPGALSSQLTSVLHQEMRRPILLLRVVLIVGAIGTLASVAVLAFRLFGQN